MFDNSVTECDNAKVYVAFTFGFIFYQIPQVQTFVILFFINCALWCVIVELVYYGTRFTEATSFNKLLFY